MSYQKSIKVVIPVLSASLFTLQAEAKQPVAKPSRPNVVIIYGDDIGYGDFSCYGSRSISTPNVDRLASEGIRFTNTHSAASTCTPSRYALISGEYAWRRDDTGIAPGDASMIISPDSYTIADLFKTAGYATGIVGKWHLGLGDKAGKQDWNGLVTPSPNDLGFDYSYIMAATLDRVPCVFLENGRVVNLDPNDPISVSYKLPFPGEPTGKDNPELLTVLRPSYGHDQSIVNGVSRIGYMKGGKSACWKDEDFADTITRKAVQFLEMSKDAPFFLYFATGDIHVPRVPHPRFVGKSGMGARGDAILSFDACVGAVVKTLERLDLMDNTIIIVSSDNGAVIDDGYKDRAVELLGNHKPWNNFRGAKGSMFEGGTRIPCIVRWKGAVKPQISNALLCQMDWFASFAAMLKINLPKGAAPDSEDLFQSWIGKSKKGRAYFVEQNNNTKPLAICTDRWKYIPPHQGVARIKQTNSETGISDKPQLYDLINDIGERNNLADQYPGILEKLSGRLKLIQQRNK
jgi:arylsulfatase A-like enzyme